MATKRDRSAFPILYTNVDGVLMNYELGMSKRELYAAYALMGLLANPGVDGTHEDIAIDALEYTDALIAKLNEISVQSD